MASVAPGALTGNVRIQQNGVSSDALSFTVAALGGNTLVPNMRHGGGRNTYNSGAKFERLACDGTDLDIEQPERCQPFNI